MITIFGALALFAAPPAPATQATAAQAPSPSAPMHHQHHGATNGGPTAAADDCCKDGHDCCKDGKADCCRHHQPQPSSPQHGEHAH